jgi:D-methionine transport system substrate-binding protein
MPAPLQLPPSPPAADGLAAQVPRTIWTYWNQPALDPFVQQCVDSWQRQCPDHEVIVVTPGNLGRYVASGDIPEAFAQLHPTKQSDWLRLYLVAHHGGYWFDATTLLTAPLDWMHAAPGTGASELAGFYLEGFTRDRRTIRVATSPGPYSELFQQGVQPILEKDGYKVEIKDFTELQQADTALQENSADLNVDQHTAYMKNFNKETGADLASLTQIPTVPSGLYSSKHKDLKEIADGQSVSVPEDASNTSRALRLLKQAGWITVKPGTDETSIRMQDIADNPHKLDIRTMDSAFIPRGLDDVDWAVIPGSMAYASGVDQKLQLLQEELLPDLILVAVTQQDQVDSDWAKAVTDAYRSDEFADYLKGRNEGNYWFVPDDLKK